MLFNELPLEPKLLQAIAEKGYTNATPIQEKAIPPILEQRDLIGLAQTGTGKTAAFAIPILELLHAKKTARWRYQSTNCHAHAWTRYSNCR